VSVTALLLVAFEIVEVSRTKVKANAFYVIVLQNVAAVLQLFKLFFYHKHIVFNCVTKSAQK
jgi:hypothetical protein